MPCPLRVPGAYFETFQLLIGSYSLCIVITPMLDFGAAHALKESLKAAQIFFALMRVSSLNSFIFLSTNMLKIVDILSTPFKSHPKTQEPRTEKACSLCLLVFRGQVFDSEEGKEPRYVNGCINVNDSVRR
ncbi:hypothetical protein LOAG_05960 [Loa loa]|uniref:Uncharacterized protein n=1 Tax=Loa loa TaxID=7209 RepID=A0A1S0TZN1_LOALO|nr:hypothetical protein LOAG_05960 [Loa loa]EFO22523.1 hypothetical protein LOAG_05960 [Loa loa]